MPWPSMAKTGIAMADVAIGVRDMDAMLGCNTTVNSNAMSSNFTISLSGKAESTMAE